MSRALGHKELDAEQVAGMEFPTATDGYDRLTVRSFLEELAEEIRAFKRANIAANRRASLAEDEVKATVSGLLAVAESLESELSALGNDLQTSSRKIASNIRDLQSRMNRRFAANHSGDGTDLDPLEELVDSIQEREGDVFDSARLDSEGPPL